jgi:hypothetical protein
MKIEKPDIIQVNSCKLVIPNDKKSIWYILMASLAIQGAEKPDDFIINSLCQWHPNKNYTLIDIGRDNEKHKIVLKNNKCTFPVFVWNSKEKTHLRDHYNSVCKNKEELKLRITNWGVDFSGDNRIWGRTGVKLSNGSEIYVWLERSGGCYHLSMSGAYSGTASNCSTRVNGSWATNSCNSGQFWADGSPSDVVRSMVEKCGK